MDAELRIESHKPGVNPGETYVRITHAPSGVWVDGSGPSRRKLEDELMGKIETILEGQETEEQERQRNRLDGAR